MIGWLLALMLLATPAQAIMSWAADEQFKEDPKDCDEFACNDAGERAKIQAFPYWDYLSNRWGQFMLGVDDSGECLWMVTCDHCSMTNPTAAFHSDSQWAGQTFDSMGTDKETRQGGAYRQFFTPLGSTMGGANNTVGDGLYCLKAQEGETLPDVPFVNVLTGDKGIPNGALIMAFGRGDFMASDTLGWFAECCTTAGCGNPSAPTVDSCCSSPTERISGQYDPAADAGHQANLPQSKTVTRPSAYGGEGSLADCGPNGSDLTYLGPVWKGTSGDSGLLGQTVWRWATWVKREEHFSTNTCLGSGDCYTGTPSGVDPYLKAQFRLDNAQSCPDWDWCLTTTSTAADYRETLPPAVKNNTRQYCKYNTAVGSPGYTQSSIWTHDSGGPTFAYIDNDWYYIGSSDNSRTGIFHSVHQKWQWECFIHERHCP